MLCINLYPDRIELILLRAGAKNDYHGRDKLSMASDSERYVDAR